MVTLKPVKAAEPWEQAGNYFVYNVSFAFTQPEVNSTYHHHNVSITDVTNDNITVRYKHYDPADPSSGVDAVDTYNNTTRESELNPGYYSWLWIYSSDLTNGSVRVENRTATVGGGNATLHRLLWNDTSGNQTEYFYRKSDLMFDHSTDHFINETTEFNATLLIMSQGGGGGGYGGGGFRPPTPTRTRSVQEWVPPWNWAVMGNSVSATKWGTAYSRVLGGRWDGDHTFDQWAYVRLEGTADAYGYGMYSDVQSGSFTPPGGTRTYWAVWSFDIRGYMKTVSYPFWYEYYRLGFGEAENFIKYGAEILDSRTSQIVGDILVDRYHCHTRTEWAPWVVNECEYDWGSIREWPSPYRTFIGFYVYLYAGVSYNFNAWAVNDNWAETYGMDVQLAQTNVLGHLYAFKLYW